MTPEKNIDSVEVDTSESQNADGIARDLVTSESLPEGQCPNCRFEYHYYLTYSFNTTTVEGPSGITVVKNGLDYMVIKRTGPINRHCSIRSVLQFIQNQQPDRQDIVLLNWVRLDVCSCPTCEGGDCCVEYSKRGSANTAE